MPSDASSPYGPPRDPVAHDDGSRRRKSGATDLQSLAESAVPRAVAEQVKIAKRLTDPASTAASLAAQAGVKKTVQQAIEDQRRFQNVLAGNADLGRLIKEATGSFGGGVARALEENQHRFQNLIAGGPMPDARYLSSVRGVLDAIGSATSVRQPATMAAPAPRANPALAPASIDSVADIGARVRAARRAMGMTQQRFADLAGVGRRFVVELEKGKASLETGKVLAVCKAAGVALTFAP